MLEVNNITVHYGHLQVLWGLSIEIKEGEVVCIIGPNGAGKSTLVSAITGIAKISSGEISFKGERIDGLPIHQRIGRGISHVLERRRVFPYMTVLENLEMGAYSNPKKFRRSLEVVFQLFPKLKDRVNQEAGTLSGGEQQMLAIGRGLMPDPKLLILDEPFLGLAPEIVDQVTRIIKNVNELGVSILFIEQNVDVAFKVSDRGYVLESGLVALEGSAADLLSDRRVQEVYLGAV